MAAMTVTGHRTTARSLHRRSLVAGAFAGIACPSIGASAAVDPDWRTFKAQFLATDGRIIDTGNGGISHSEGQGWGLLFAAANDDKAAFQSIYNWTQMKLKRPGDTLHAWRYVPTDPTPVSDKNNATDGDIFIAAALARAGRQWGNAAYLQIAAAMTRDLLTLTVRHAGSQALLLPGASGFETDALVTINPSYYAFPFITEIARLAPAPQWDAILNDGIGLIERARFGKWQLPPDWLRFTRANGAVGLAPKFPPRFSYDAIRVPLWLAWQNQVSGKAAQALDRFWSSYPNGSFPAWVDLATNDVATYKATPGLVAVARLMQAVMKHTTPVLPSVADAGKYYDAALVMLTRLAWRELSRG